MTHIGGGNESAFRDGRKDQTSDAQLRIGELQF